MVRVFDLRTDAEKLESKVEELVEEIQRSRESIDRLRESVERLEQYVQLQSARAQTERRKRTQNVCRMIKAGGHKQSP